jgi:hypothetical protein
VTDQRGDDEGRKFERAHYDTAKLIGKDHPVAADQRRADRQQRLRISDILIMARWPAQPSCFVR